ncbi:hypothetical protein N0V93_000113 [Gnomoniopsis smithogilvyi]|uniref:Heterokaryon incompatibility domain-containing protein n=1 Tax=Gnomoniopsis smithogilvyi TaxID=1191159 RepID=A0A9W9CZX4_9PEZI|nr:hypothetical protein N0V93_000113 [Gnomoniopsis smithogilvyi]
MCLDEDRGATHSCVEDCQACYVFTVENLQLLAQDEGASVSLGTLAELVPIADQGCNFCKGLLHVAIQSGKPWAQDALVELKPVESYQRDESLLPGQIDKIRIHFMDPINLGSSSFSYQEYEFHRFSIDLGIHTTTPELKQIIPKTPASPQVATPEVFQEIGHWIDDCLENHTECPGNLNTKLPTRVIDVGTDAHLPSENVKLHISSTGECGRYAALSYCWGTGTQTRTLKQNLEEHMRSITVSSLPQTIQDAIRVTRELKIRYLWVDALCIIQESDDWEREATRMPDIYKNAVVTISAAAAVDSHQGFLEDRQSLLMSQVLSSRFPVYKLESDDGNDEEMVTLTSIGEIFLTQDADLGYDLKEFDDENINTRAWTLQEMWLAPRLVCFGTGLPRWICLKHDRTYGVDKVQPRYSFDKSHEVRRQIFTEGSSSGNNMEIAVNGHLDRDDFLSEWGILSINYYRRKLTFKTDRMAAISGIAKEFEKLLNDQYVAGLWKSSLPESLLWRHENWPQEESLMQAKGRKRDKILGFFASKRKSASTSSTAVEPYIGPSWSPLANNGSIVMSSPSHTGFETLCVVNDVQVEPANPLAPFLAIKPGHDWIDLTAPMAQMSYEEIVAFFVIVTVGSPHIYWDWILPDGGAANEYLGPAAKFQMKHPKINPQVLSDFHNTSAHIGGPPLIREDGQRPNPPSATTDAWPDKPVNTKKRTRGVPDVDFWFLEIEHSNTPTGLVLIRVDGNRFKRIGKFKMCRNQSPNWLMVNGLEISGPRRWNWDAKLKMRNCIIN